MKGKNSINLIQPKPFQEVGARFVVSGWVPKTWFETGHNPDYRIFTEYIDINCKTFMGGSIDIRPSLINRWWSRFQKKIYFSETVQFNSANIYFLENSQGRIVIKLNGQKEDKQFFFIPLVVSQFEPKDGVNPEIIKKQKSVENKVIQFSLDLKNYNEELKKIWERRQQKDEIFENKKSNEYFFSQNIDVASHILNILNQSEEIFEDYLYSQEDKEEKELEEKYKDALEWRGPLAYGLIAKMDGFEMRVYSNDHDKHFHVIHRGKGINARFSFPEIKLMNYKNSRNTIGSKEESQIREFCKETTILEKLEKEFNKRK